MLLSISVSVCQAAWLCGWLRPLTGEVCRATGARGAGAVAGAAAGAVAAAGAGAAAEGEPPS